MDLANGLADDALEIEAEAEARLLVDLVRFAARFFALGQRAKLIDARADERIAAAKMVIEKVERLIARDGR